MQELIQKLQDMHGVSGEQAHGILNTVKEYIKEKFPMVGGAVDSIFGTTVPPDQATTTPVTPVQENKGEEFLDEVKGKLGGLFNKG